jgi:hypothetical protein
MKTRLRFMRLWVNKIGWQRGRVASWQDYLQSEEHFTTLKAC